jgi:hypothetical protein
MKNQHSLTKLTLLFNVLLTLVAVTAQADILPNPNLDLAPTGITMGQTARLNLVNLDVPGGLFINWTFIDAKGNILAHSAVTLPMGQTVSVDYKRQGGPLRVELRVQVDILNPNVPAESLRASLEVFDNVTGATTVCMSGTAP